MHSVVRSWLRRIAAVSIIAATPLAPVACGGSEFGAGSDNGGSSGEGGAVARAGSSNSAGHMGKAGKPPASPEGGDGSVGGGISSSAGAFIGNAGEPGVAGSGATPGCDTVGAEHAGHCYVDATAQGSWKQAEAAAACDALAASFGRAGSLLILESPEEHAFVLEQFMKGHEAQDAWLSLTCSEVAHPSLADCFCTGCGEDLLFSKRQNWLWPSEISTGFGWHAASPNGDGRCSALTYKPTLLTWGWADRDCSKNSFEPAPGVTRTYRVICELE